MIFGLSGFSLDLATSCLCLGATPHPCIDPVTMSEKKGLGQIFPRPTLATFCGFKICQLNYA